MRKPIIIDNKETGYEISDIGEVFNIKTGRQLKGTYARNEYHSVQLRIDGKSRSFLTHRLVAEAFIPNPDNLNIVDHINRDKYDNRVENLRWVDDSTNILNREKAASREENLLSPEQVAKEDWIESKISSDLLVSKNGFIFKKNTGQGTIGTYRNGYRRTQVNGTTYSIHRIIWETFNGEIPVGFVIDHIDGNRSNNALSNLRLVTQSENMFSAQENGHRGQVSVKQYDSKGNFIQEYPSYVKAAAAIDGDPAGIRQAALRHGRSKNFFWINGNDETSIENIIKEFFASKPKKNKIRISQYDKDHNFIKTFESLSAAGRAVNATGQNIKKAAENEQLYKNYYWILSDN